MDQQKIGAFLTDRRKSLGLTQGEIAQKLHVSNNAVSKWERGICLMDLSLLKPLAEILQVEVIDILSGENISQTKSTEKYEEAIINIVKHNKMESKAFGAYGLIIAFIVLVFFKTYNKLNYSDLMVMVSSFITAKFLYKYKIEKKTKNILIAVLFLTLTLVFLLDFIKSVDLLK